MKAAEDRACAARPLRATPFATLQHTQNRFTKKRTTYLLPNRTDLFTTDRNQDAMPGPSHENSFTNKGLRGQL